MKQKFEQPTKNMGKKFNRQRVAEAGKHLVESRKYPSIKDSLGL